MTVVESGDAVATPRRDLPPSMIERMTLVLSAFDSRTSRLTLEEVTYRAQLPRSTVHRILLQLVRLNWVEHASFGYCLGRRALGLAGGDGGHSEIRAAAAPLLHELHMQTGMVVHLAVLDGAESVYLDKIGGRFASTLPSRVGGRGPAYSTAGGKSMLAWLDPSGSTACTSSGWPPAPTEPSPASRRCTRNSTASGSGAGWHSRAASQFAEWRASASPSVDTRARSPPSRCAARRVRQPLERVAPLVADAAREVSRTLHPELGQPRRARRAASPPAATWSAEAMDRLLAIQSGQWI